MGITHFTMQGKGGVGKTFVASVLAQYISDLIGDNGKIAVVDTDPVNATLSQYDAFEVEHLEIQEKDSTRINERNFDSLIEKMVADPDTHFVVDNGAASFVPLSNYLIENSAIEMLVDMGREVWVHPVITGGQGMLDTLNGLAQIVEQLPETVKIVVWKNTYFGDIEKDGKSFEQMAVYKKNADRIHAVVEIPKYSADTYGIDIEQMLQRKLSFDQAASSEDFGLMSRQRLKNAKSEIYERVGEVLG
ncbi:MAG: ArsA-related P-loop ATPase [Candidatus Sedimenticola endophacoides]